MRLDVFVQGNNQIIEIDPVEWQALLIWINQQKAKTVVGKDPPIVLEDPVLLSTFPKSFRIRTQEFALRLQTVTPVKDVDGFWVGSGCEAHRCGSSEAAWAIDPDTAKGFAILVFPDYPDKSGESEQIFETFGGPLDTLPEPLRAWAEERGVAEGRRVEYPE